MQGDLTTKDRVKQWLLPPAQWGSDSSDVLFDGLITAASGFILNQVNRDFGWQETTEVYDGQATGMLQLRQAPVTAVSSIDLGNGQTIDMAASPAQYLLDAPRSTGSRQRLIIRDRQFPRGLGNVVVTYSFGWRETMTATIAAATTLQPLRMFFNDIGVTIGGVAATKVTDSPGVGQYAVTDAGIYSFNDADAGSQAVISYGYVPAEIELATRQLVADQYKAKDRIGIVSHSVGGQETTSFSQKDMSQFVKSLLKPYTFVTPR